MRSLAVAKGAAQRAAAHFLLDGNLAGSPPNEAIIAALLEAGFVVDLYTPGGDVDTRIYGARVSAHSVTYGRRWLLRNAWLPSWRRYSILSGTAEDPAAVIGMIGVLHRRPWFTLADEIKSDGYRGDRPESWKRLCRWAMRGSAFTIVNDESRIALQRRYAGLAGDHEVLVYPACFRDLPRREDRHMIRQRWGVPAGGLAVVCSGHFNRTAGAEWLISGLQGVSNMHLVLQPPVLDEFVRFMLLNCRGSERLYVEGRRLSWREAWASMGGADIGVAVYLNEAPQFQHMGLSSNRLCMYLAMGVPVIASAQQSFRFLEQFDCGVLVRSAGEFAEAVGFVGSRLDVMRRNAVRCAEEYIKTPERYKKLVCAVRRVHDSQRIARTVSEQEGCWNVPRANDRP